MCIYDKFSKPCKSYLVEDTIFDFINSMTEESNNVVMR